MNFLGSRTLFDYGTILLTRDRALNIVKTQSPFPSACSNWPCCSCATLVETNIDELQIPVIKKVQKECRENEDDRKNVIENIRPAVAFGGLSFVNFNIMEEVQVV